MKKIILILIAYCAFVAACTAQPGVTPIKGVSYRVNPTKNATFFSGSQNLTACSKVTLNDSSITAAVGTFTTINTSTVSSASATYTTVTTTNLVFGNVKGGYVGKTTNYTITTSDYCVAVTGDSSDLTLPTAESVAGRMYVVKNITGTAKSIPLRTTSSQNIDGSAAPLIITTKKSYIVMSNGSNWIIISAF